MKIVLISGGTKNNMNKKKVISLAAVGIIGAIALSGASIAYFSDTKTATNTFTVGNVKIDLVEQQTVKGADGKVTGLEAFVQNKVLKPGTSKDGNAVSKIVTIENTGENAAWVWVDLKVPAYLVSSDFKAEPHNNESMNALHWNNYGHFTTEYNAGGNYAASPISDGIIDTDGNVKDTNMVSVADGLWNNFKYVGTETIDGTEYVVVRSTMKNTLPAGKTSLPALRQVYQDWRVQTSTDADGNNIYTLPDGTTISTDASWKVIVNAYAIQADGIANVDAAITAYANNGK